MSNASLKMSETIIMGKNSRVSSLHYRDPSAKPLKTIGLHGAWLVAVDEYYRLTHERDNFTFFKLIFALEGETELETYDGVFTIKAGDFAHIPSTVYKRQEMVKGSSYRELGFTFYEHAATDRFKTDKLIIRKATQANELVQAFENYISEAGSLQIMSERSAFSYAEILSILLLREVQHEHYLDILWTARFAKLQKLIVSDLAKEWTVSAMAETVFVSPPHFYRLTKKLFNKTPNQYLTELRMRQALQLLSGTNYSLDSISSLVGYANAHSFSNAFQRHYGQRPGKFRKSS